MALAGSLYGCNDSDDDTPAISTPSANKFFNRIASFPLCSQVGSSCESGNTSTAAEIVTASTDGMTLIYSNSPNKQIGFVDITDPTSPKAKCFLAMGGEPTSVTVLGAHVLVAVNTSANFVSPSGKLAVVDIATQKVVAEIALPGQPDSITASKDGNYVAIAIENERDKNFGDGRPPQLPGGSLVIVDSVGSPSGWKTRTVNLTGIAALYPTDPEPEYLDINEDNVVVVTLQENNHIVLVDLKTSEVTWHFSAGSVNLSQVDATDERPNLVKLTQ